MLISGRMVHVPAGRITGVIRRGRTRFRSRRWRILHRAPRVAPVTLGIGLGRWAVMDLMIQHGTGGRRRGGGVRRVDVRGTTMHHPRSRLSTIEAGRDETETLAVMVVERRQTWTNRGGRSERLSQAPGDPIPPVLGQQLVLVVLAGIDEERPAESEEPLSLERVELAQVHTTHLGPRSVLKGAIVEELAAEDEGDGQHTIRVGRGDLILTQRRQSGHAHSHVVQGQQDGGAG